MKSYYCPAIFSSFTTLIAAESTRVGGVSPVPFSSLNLGINTADEVANVDENRRRFFSDIGAGSFQFASSHQIHSTAVLHTTEPGRFDGYDALITNQPNLLIGVTVADCVPILLYDHRHQAVGAVHAGWRGTVGGIVTQTLLAMQNQYGTLPEDCYGYVGTCIDECAFEVGPEVAEQFLPAFKRADHSSGKSYIDLKAANFRLLTDFGIPVNQISISSFSTVLNNDLYFSYRAEGGHTGRMLAVIGIKQ
ncbi:peptidoglycan editing factor PgeF [Spirosoma sp.]|uniref:peptidoglycan editing factor PgeF n=1 Tax=Spirosoma sp. TaxID=1899569 RepID=UPI002613E5C0|nr:peptidoglycan editing factor PgeF [Spirosoma sp.]MCX6217188.1 peptidoglycan editing factor PgeF [Spirosoma sp.]